MRWYAGALIGVWNTQTICAVTIPKVIWFSNPTTPNETVIVNTPNPLSFESLASVSICDGDGTDCEDVNLQQTSSSSSKFLIPAGRPMGVYSVLAGPRKREVARLNEV